MSDWTKIVSHNKAIKTTSDIELLNFMERFFNNDPKNKVYTGYE